MKKRLGRFLALALSLCIMLGIFAFPKAEAVYGYANRRWFLCEELNNTLTETQERMAAAHDMAEAARALGLPESSDVILLAKSIWNTANQEQEAAQAALDSLHCDSHAYSYELFKPTNLSVEAFDHLLEGSALAGHGKEFRELEELYGVNGLFAMAVAKVESGLGRSKLAVNKNNYYGMLGNSFATPREGILAFGRLMNKKAYYGKSLDAIAKTYCPPTAAAWSDAVTDLMSTYWVRLT